MKAKGSCFIGLLLVLALIMIFMAPNMEIYASEEEQSISGELKQILEEGFSFSETREEVYENVEQVEPFKEAEKEALDIIGSLLQKIIMVIPYLGAILLVVGVFFGVLSIKNKSYRRYGVRMAILGPISMFVLYVGFCMYYDGGCARIPFEIAEKEDGLSLYEEIYYNNIELLEKEGQLFTVMGHKTWYRDAALVGRRFYSRSSFWFGAACVSLGFLFVVITKQNKSFRRWALVGMCIVIPLVLVVGYQYIAI